MISCDVYWALCSVVCGAACGASNFSALSILLDAARVSMVVSTIWPCFPELQSRNLIVSRCVENLIPDASNRTSQRLCPTKTDWMWRIQGHRAKNGSLDVAFKEWLKQSELFEIVLSLHIDLLYLNAAAGCWVRSSVFFLTLSYM